MHNKDETQDKRIWLIPVIALLITLLWGLFTRVMVGLEDEQHFDFETTPFVPAESPFSSGQDSR
jgi:hypothetical protein